MNTVMARSPVPMLRRHTTHGRKESMALLVREALRVGKLSYSNYFFSISMAKDDAKRRMGDELRNFSVVSEPGKGHFSKVRLIMQRGSVLALTLTFSLSQSRKTYTGKLGGQQDDVVISLQLCMIAMRTFFEDARYAQFSRQSS